MPAVMALIDCMTVNSVASTLHSMTAMLSLRKSADDEPEALKMTLEDRA